MKVSVCCESVPYDDELSCEEGDMLGICLECSNESVFIDVKKQDDTTSVSWDKIYKWCRLYNNLFYS